MMKIILWLFLILLLGMGALLGLLFIYQDEIKATLIEELNKNLKSEVRIEPANIDLTIIKTFPDCSIEFKDLLMLEALPLKNRDTLLFAKQLNLYFNIKDIWNKKYEIEKIKLKSGVVKLKVLKNGQTNYLFWKKSTTSTDAKNDSIRFNLKLIQVEDCYLIYKDRKNVFKTEVQIKKLSFKGQFSDANYELNSEAKLLVYEIAQGKTSYLKNKNCSFSLNLNVSNNDYTFKKAELRINQLALDLEGMFAYKDSLENLNISYNAANLEIASALSLLPEKFKEKINDYESSGNLYAKGRIKYSNKNIYSVTSDFGMQQARITYKPQSTTAENVNLDGHLKITGASSLLELKKISLTLNNDEIRGNCIIRSFSDPFIQCKAQASVHLENIQKFWPIDTLTALKGNLNMTIEAEGLLKDLKDRTFSTNVRLYLNAHVSALEAQFKGDEKIYAVENCSLTAGDREIEVKDLILTRGSSTIKINGKVPGLFNHLVDRTNPLMIIGSVYSNNLKMEDFMGKSNASSTATTTNESLIPANLFCKLNAAILKFSFGKFEARALTGDIEIKNQKTMVSDVKFETMEGSAEIDAIADNSKNKLDITLQASFKNININTMFSQLNNFGQQTLKDENLKGFATSTLEFSGSWNNALVADLNSIRAMCNLNIEKGELIDFKPLLSLSKFVEVEELKRVKFSSLQSNIEIKNSVISIPKTSIKNSALNIDVWGTHTFNNEIDYHIQLLISDLLARKRKNSDTEFGPVERDKDNKRSAFLLMTGTIDNPIIKYDRRGLKEKIGADIKQEKQNLKQVLKEEFGLFRKDSIKREKKSEQVFELEKQTSPPPKKTLELKKKEDEDDF